MERWRPFGNTLERWEPFGLGDVQGEMNRLLESVFSRPATLATGERMWVPPADIRESKDDLYVSFELPGVPEKEISVSIMEDVLTVKGERRPDQEQEAEGYHRTERVYGRFERSLSLPIPVQVDKIKATYRDGVLEIRMPKVEEIKPREIKIDVQ
jgi:HSP20 family protein